MIIYRCPCGEVYKAADEQAGSPVRCPACARVLRVPSRGNPPPNPAPAVVTYQCVCGRAFKVIADDAVRRVKCPVCGAWGEARRGPADGA